jgi:hypothetical protein
MTYSEVPLENSSLRGERNRFSWKGDNTLILGITDDPITAGAFGLIECFIRTIDKGF